MGHLSCSPNLNIFHEGTSDAEAEFGRLPTEGVAKWFNIKSGLGYGR
jgi:hypothetical protein